MNDRCDDAASTNGRRPEPIAWRRELMLPRLIGVGPEEIADDGPSGRSRILRRLESALRSERVRGRSGHWSYSLDRHVGLMQAVEAERDALRRLTGPTGRAIGPSRPRNGETAPPSRMERSLE